MLRKTIPVLVHVDNFSDAKTDETELKNISQNVGEIHDEMNELIPSESTIHDRLVDANNHLETLEATLETIEDELGKQSDPTGSLTISGQIKQISAATGHSTDTSDENSVIGLLKSIANKLS